MEWIERELAVPGCSGKREVWGAAQAGPEGGSEEKESRTPMNSYQREREE